MKTAGALLGVPECSGGERSEPERNGGTPSSEAPADGGAQKGRPDPEVLETPKRRQFSAEYKARIVQEADLCTQWGQVGAVLRREGLHWSQLRKWRSIFRKAVHTALKDDKRGRKCVKHPLEAENERLRKQIGRLEHRLRQAETVIDVQKKISEILGIPLKDSESGEDD